ncbi:hypothetical protein CS0771_04270 [Catellatospora sp. IY07-71]|uniref:LpqB family beta-propeller domain-containing protein n=1 Tax=Catellatospora sp. IY07-71 TaxID=2728827 RepID=UPI001BB3FC61|nr:LpqB family beta-propeller domain-containing protein [Catellatospora sp. IY07-71]BCJ70883.1 hypothetical protein CS0771_04270 [Catellatospora sp. IY07-71]
MTTHQRPAPHVRRGVRGIAGLLAVGLSGVLLTGCGISVPSGVTRVGVGPSAGPGGQLSYTNPEPPKWSAADDRTVLVENFLSAAAGDYFQTASRNLALTNVKSFLAPNLRDNWSPGSGTELTLVRRTPGGMTREGERNVVVEMTTVGTLNSDGQFVPEQQPKKSSYTFEFGPAEGGGLHLIKQPPALWLDVDKLETYYVKQPVYFWNKDRTSLVTDVRYVPKALPAEQHGNRLVDYLLSGPAEWLDQVVAPQLPGTTSRIDLIVADGSEIKVNLRTDLPEAQFEKFASQLFWTLTPSSKVATIKLKVNRVEFAADLSSARNDLAAAGDVRDPARFGLVDGVLTRLSVQAPLPLDAKLNQNVVRAAVAREESLFALVKTVKGKPELYLARDDQQRRITGLPDALTELAWLDGKADVLLVLGSGRLYAVGGEGGKATALDTSRLPTSQPITSFAVAPDGRRIALIADGRLYMAGLVRQKSEIAGIGEPYRVPLSELDTALRGVGFVGLDTLVVAGSASKVRLAEITVDGALEAQYRNDQAGEISNLTAFVDQPGKILFDIDGISYQAYNNNPPKTTLEPKLHEVPTASPSPGASASPSPPQQVTVTGAIFEG